MTQRGRGSKRVRDQWESSVVVSDSPHAHLYVPLNGKMYLSKQFKAGDKVRVTVELLARTRKG